MPQDFELKKIEKGTTHFIKKEYGLSKIGIGIGRIANPVNEDDVLVIDFSLLLKCTHKIFCTNKVLLI